MQGNSVSIAESPQQRSNNNQAPRQQIVLATESQSWAPTLGQPQPQTRALLLHSN